MAITNEGEQTQILLPKNGQFALSADGIKSANAYQEGNNVIIQVGDDGNGIDLAKAIGISLGAGAAVGAAALGAHTVKKAKENNIYEQILWK